MSSRFLSRKGKTAASLFTAMGIVCLLAAAAFLIYNLMQDAGGKKKSARAVSYLTDIIQAETQEENKSTSDGGETLPAYMLNPDMAMPEAEYDGYLYIGLLEIDSLSLRLPIISQWDYSALKTAPRSVCRLRLSGQHGHCRP